MAADPFELVARLLGIDPEQLRKFAANSDDDPDLDTLSELLDIDLTTITDLYDVDPSEFDWDVTVDADANRIEDAPNAPRRSRRGIGIRPGHRRPRSKSSQETSPTRASWECPTCDRTFLSYRGLQRHYETNPSHAEATLDTRQVDPEPNDGYEPDSEWVVFDDRVETFVSLPDDVEENEITVAYRPTEEAVVISGAYEESIDTSHVSDIVVADVTWQLSGRYLIISLSKPHDRSQPEENDGE